MESLHPFLHIRQTLEKTARHELSILVMGHHMRRDEKHKLGVLPTLVLVPDQILQNGYSGKQGDTGIVVRAEAPCVSKRQKSPTRIAHSEAG